MKKLTESEMKRLKAQLNEMDYNAEALLTDATISMPEPNTQATVCKAAAALS